LAWSSKNGNGSGVVVGSGSVRSSYDSVNGDENSSQKLLDRESNESPLCVLRAAQTDNNTDISKMLSTLLYHLSKYLDIMTLLNLRCPPLKIQDLPKKNVIILNYSNFINCYLKTSEPG
jgi:hypothetical protein